MEGVKKPQASLLTRVGTSLTVKWFGTLMLAFIVLISGLILGLELYFTHLYETAKIQSTIGRLNDFALTYQGEGWTDPEFYRRAQLFAAENNVNIGLLPDREGEEGDGEEREGSSDEASEGEDHGQEEGQYVLVTILDTGGSYYDFFVTLEHQAELNLQTGAQVQVEALQQTDQVLLPFVINGHRIEVSSVVDSPLYKGQGKIVTLRQNLNLPDQETAGSIQYKEISKGSYADVSYVISELPHTGIQQVEFRRRLTLPGRGRFVLMGTGSLQPVAEILGLIKGFYPFFGLGALVLAVFISWLYARTVIRPIKEITTVADRMAHLDFDQKLSTNRSDELGILSESLNSLSTGLEGALGDLTIANAQLQADIEREKKQEQARKEFVANASHELKTPLGIVRSYAEGLRETQDPVQQTDYVAVIEDEVEKMDGLIQDMLAISKYDSFDVVIRKEPVDMLILTSDLVQGFEKHLEVGQLRLAFEGDFGSFDLDKEKITAAMTNLLSNAVKYAKTGTILVLSSRDLGEEVEFQVTNTCEEAFTEDQLEKVWERFYKRDVAHTNEVEGTGLGLSIVKRIFEAHGLAYGNRADGDQVTFWFRCKKTGR